MANGTVKWFNATKGYGFIRPDEGEGDAFVHITEVERSGMATLSEGRRVRFTPLPQPRGLKPVDLVPRD